MLCGCSKPTFNNMHDRLIAKPRLDRALNTALSWPSPPDVDALLGARLFEDGSRVSYPEIAITRAILRTNPRIAAMAALGLADATVRAARRQSLPPEFLGATILQESAYDPRALSSAGAVGLAQFMPDTASANGVNPYDPYDAIDGASRLLGRYVRSYRGLYTDAYAAALAAYNAGPGAVAYYRGIPPYAETREYIEDIYERWARVASYESPARLVH
jgi:soluble lytic murein transglycosylase-like protein